MTTEHRPGLAETLRAWHNRYTDTQDQDDKFPGFGVAPALVAVVRAAQTVIDESMCDSRQERDLDAALAELDKLVKIEE